MPSQDKLIKQGLKYTDSLFDEISKRLEQGVRASDSLEAFLDKYNKAFPDKGNPLLALGYDEEMLKLILSETNNHKFSRPAQKELVRVTIESQVGELIRDVGEDIRESVRDIVKDGYDNNLSEDEIAANISSKVSAIKGRRARAIARTEIARTATISDYVINKERGATHFYVECRNTACPICKDAWHKHWSKSNDESFNPHETSAGGKGWIGDKVYSMSDTMMLPPIHPNCRCVPYFISEDDVPDGVSVEEPKPKETTTTTEPTSKRPTNNDSTMVEKSSFEENGAIYKVYEYKNTEIAISEKSNFTSDQIKEFLDSRPGLIQKQLNKLQRINIHHYSLANKGGNYNTGTKVINVYSHNNKAHQYNVLNHELGHFIDNLFSGKNQYGLSKIENYEKYFKADNELEAYTTAKGKRRVPNRFVSNYAASKFIYYKNKFKKIKDMWDKNELFRKHNPDPFNKQYVEDWAESSAFYLNPYYHESFVKAYPNRARLLETIYGKPTWDKNSDFYRTIMQNKDYYNSSLHFEVG